MTIVHYVDDNIELVFVNIISIIVTIEIISFNFILKLLVLVVIS